MGIFTRFRDIVNSNINAMLDHAEDPEKLIKMMIREMEDTLVEIKAACAGVMASGKKIERQMDDVRLRIQYWSEKATLAVRKGRDDLARDALLEKRKLVRKARNLEKALRENDLLVDQYHDDIRQLEEKLQSAREKERILIQRHLHASRKMRAQEEIRRADSTDVIQKFDELENRIERMEVEADLVNFGAKPNLEEALERLAVDDEIEQELLALKSPSAIPEEAPSSRH